MNRSLFLVYSLLFIQVALVFVPADASVDAVMRAVVSVSGRGSSGEPVFASAFLVESRSRNTFWLVSSAHSFNRITDEYIRVNLRRCERGVYFPCPLQVRIREGSRTFYFAHTSLDLAAIKIEIPSEADCCMLSRDFIADEKQLNRLTLGAGSQVIIVGYPYGESCNEAGFAFARSGIVSSFPVRPASIYPVFFVDFEVFAGYSGAPVISNNGSALLGMVMEEVFLEELRPRKGKKQLRTSRGLGLAKVLSAPLIVDFIESLR